MGGKGSGGGRPGSGRKKRGGVDRHPGGRIIYRGACACGAPTSRPMKTTCLSCHSVARAAKPRPCTHCGALVDQRKPRQRLPGHKGPSRTCSPGCAALRNEANWQAMRLPGVREKERLRRRRASTKRRAAGWIGGRRANGRWRRICERDGWVCWICGREILRENHERHHRLSPTCDHVIPLALGGSDEDGNVRAAHLGCNSWRGQGWRVGLLAKQGVADGRQG